MTQRLVRSAGAQSEVVMKSSVFGWRVARPLRDVIAVAVLTVVGTPIAKATMECDEAKDCLNGTQASVCVQGECVPCTQDPGQCDEYSYGQGGDLNDPFCEQESGMCWECGDCIPYACDPGGMQCITDCDQGQCADNYECDTESGCPDTCWWNPYVPTGLCVGNCEPPCI